MKALILDKKQETRIEDVEDNRRHWYGIIETDIVEINKRYVGGIVFDIISDEESLLKDEKIPTATHPSGVEFFFGTLIFTHFNREGEMEDLSDDDIKVLEKHIRFMDSELTEEPVMVMLLDEF